MSGHPVDVGSCTPAHPAVSAFNLVGYSTASSSAVTLAGSPVVTAVIGSSGDAEITMSANISLVNPTNGAAVFLIIDGGAVWTVLNIQNVAGATLTTDAFASFKLSQFHTGTLTPGVHTFTLQYQSLNGTTTFAFNLLKVQPI